GSMRPPSKYLRASLALVGVVSLGCASTSSTSWAAEAGPTADVPLTGQIESTQGIVRPVARHARGALAGAVIGGLLFGQGPTRLIGAVLGGAAGAAASHASPETRTYQVVR